MYAKRHDRWAWIRAYALPAPERRAAHAELRAEHQIRLERDNMHTPERRAAAAEAEARRYPWYLVW